MPDEINFGSNRSCTTHTLHEYQIMPCKFSKTRLMKHNKILPVYNKVPRHGDWMNGGIPPRTLNLGSITKPIVLIVICSFLSNGYQGPLTWG